MSGQTELAATALVHARSPVPTTRGVLSVVTAGTSGPDVVLLHGLTDNATTWLPLQRRLAQQVRLHAIDLPGHGASAVPSEPMTMAAMAEEVIAYLDAVNISKCVLVGNSLGGGVALGVCARAGMRVSAALLLGSVGAPFTLDLGLRLLRNDRAAEWMARAAATQKVRYWIIRRGFPLRYRPTDEMVSNYWKAWQEPGRARHIAALMRIHDVGEPLPWLSTIRQRVDLLHGSLDRFVPISVSQRLARELPNARLTVLPGVGHLPQHDAAQAVSDAVRQLLPS